MNVISKPGLMSFAKEHPETTSWLTSFYAVARKAAWGKLEDVRKAYPSVDQVGHVLIFNVLGGNYRLIIRVSYPGQRLWVKAMMTHKEYNRKGWMKWAE